MADRDSVAIEHFQSRSKNPKTNIPANGSPPVNLFLVFDSGFGGGMNEMGGVDYRYTGVSMPRSSVNTSCNTKTNFHCMRSAFDY
jgi:hypothetical protein